MDVPSEEVKERKKAPDWARFKEVNPDTYKSPLKNSTWETSSEHGSQASDMDIPPPPPPPKLVSPVISKDGPAFDRLGRPLLYNRLSGKSFLLYLHCLTCSDLLLTCFGRVIPSHKFYLHGNI
jgi:hypothetical protein